MLYKIVFPFNSLVMATLSKHGDRESCHDTSVVTSHVDHVVGFGIFIVSQLSSLVGIAASHHENVIFRVRTHMLLLRTLSRSRSPH